MTRTWTPSLIAKTRETLAQAVIVDPTGRYHLKNSDGRFGWIQDEDLLADRLKIHLKDASDPITYSSIDALIEAGWARDSSTYPAPGNAKPQLGST